jgi:hypothetical protein
MSSPSTSWPPSAAVVLAVGVSARIDSMTGRGHARCRSENGTRASCWRAVATSSLLGCLVTDAGAGRAPIARRRTLAASTAGAAGWAVRTLASPCEAGGGGVALSGLDRAVQRACSAPAGWPHARERLRARLDTAALCWALSASAACSGSGTADPRWGRPFSGSAQGRRAIIRPIHPTSEGVP